MAAQIAASSHVCQRRWNMRLPVRSEPWPRTGARSAMNRPAIPVAQASFIVTSSFSPKAELVR